MIKKLTQTIIPALTVAVLQIAFILTPKAHAVFNGTIGGGADSARGSNQTTDLFGNSGIFSTITDVLLFVLGAISVIMIIIGGLRYVVSGGNASNVTAAKNTILYAIVGVIIALLSYAIIKFVLGSFATGGTGGTNV